MPSLMILADPLSADVFMLTDFQVRAVRETDDPSSVLRETLAQGHEIVFVTETLVAALREPIREARERGETIVTVIPGVAPSQQLGKQMLTALKKSVIGQ